MRWLLIIVAGLAVMYAPPVSAHCPPGKAPSIFGCVPKLGGDIAKVAQDFKNFGGQIQKDVGDGANNLRKIIGGPTEKLKKEGGKAVEKVKTEAENFRRDVETWVKTGKCGGDICDVFEASKEFVKDQIKDAHQSLDRFSKRLSEGKAVDALWHLFTDAIANTQENAADATKRSNVLRATGQVAAGVYGGPQGAAAYAAWLTYNETKDLSAAIRAGIIAAVTSNITGEINAVDYSGVDGIVGKSIATGAVSGGAVAMAGGSPDDVRKAVGGGISAVLIREGYRQLTKVDLDEKQLRPSVGEAYCLAQVPETSYFTNPSADGGCLAPREAYVREPDGSAKVVDGKPVIKIDKLGATRPHVGIWGRKADQGGASLVKENGALMTGISRIPGWNAMALAHDHIANNLKLDVLTSAATIPSAVVLTYMGTGGVVQDMIRAAAINAWKQRTRKADIVIKTTPAPPMQTAYEVEVTHMVCGVRQADDKLSNRTDLLIETAVTGHLALNDNAVQCRISKTLDGKNHLVGHAHWDRHFCHLKAETILRKHLATGMTCVASLGIRTDTAALTH